MIDLSLCILIGLVVVGSIGLWAWFFPDAMPNRTWFMFGWFTAAQVFMFVQAYWHVRRSTALWLILIAWLTFHTAVHAILFRLFHDWPALAYLFTMPAEAMAMTYVIYKALDVLPKPVRGRHVGSA